MRTGNDTPENSTRSRASRLPIVPLAALLLLSTGCRKDMYDQPKYEPYDPSTIFKDGTSSRPQVVGTVARADLKADSYYYEGKADGKDVDKFPFEMTSETLELGRQRYQVFCSPCHGRLGDGRGMVVRRGFSPPPSFHAEYLRKIPVGHFYNVITHGYGAMYSYAARVPVRHRWAIAAYIRALQYSQDASPEDLSPGERGALAEAEIPGPPNPVDSKRLAEVKK